MCFGKFWNIFDAVTMCSVLICLWVILCIKQKEIHSPGRGACLLSVLCTLFSTRTCTVSILNFRKNTVKYFPSHWAWRNSLSCRTRKWSKKPSTKRSLAASRTTNFTSYSAATVSSNLCRISFHFRKFDSWHALNLALQIWISVNWIQKVFKIVRKTWLGDLECDWRIFGAFDPLVPSCIFW